MKSKRDNPNAEARRWADAVLSSLDGIGRAEANPFLYTRVLARLEEANNPWEKAARWISKPAFAVLAILVFLAINVGVILKEQRASAALASQKGNLEQMLASEFINTQTYSLVDVNEDK